MCAAIAHCVLTCIADANTSCAWVPPVYCLGKCLFMSFAHFLVTFFFPEDFFCIICMPVCLCRKMCTWVKVPVRARGGQQVSLGCPLWVLGTNRSFARAVHAVNHGAIPLAWNVLMFSWLLSLGVFLLTYLALPSVGITGMYYQAWFISIQPFCKVNILRPTYFFLFYES